TGVNHPDVAAQSKQPDAVPPRKQMRSAHQCRSMQSTNSTLQRRKASWSSLRDRQFAAKTMSHGGAPGSGARRKFNRDLSFLEVKAYELLSHHGIESISNENRNALGAQV